MKRLDIDNATFVRLYHEHKSAIVVAKLLGCTNVTVINRLREEGVPRMSASRVGRRPWNKMDMDEQAVIKYYKGARNLRKTAKHFTCSVPTIGNVLRKHGVPRDGKAIWTKKSRKSLSEAIKRTHAEGKMSGENHWNWRGGISDKAYPMGWCAALKKSIRQRDGYRCRVCDKSQQKNRQALCVHHIDYDKDNLDPKNLVSLCSTCHGQTAGNRRHWQRYFKTMLAVRRSG